MKARSAARDRSIGGPCALGLPSLSPAEGGTNWRLDPAIAGGGILLDHGWHALYCIVRWAGAPRGIAAVLENRRFHESPLEDTATLSLDLISGTGEIYLTWAGEERSNSIEIEGEQGQHLRCKRPCRPQNELRGSSHWSARRPYRKDRITRIGSSASPRISRLR